MAVIHSAVSAARRILGTHCPHCRKKLTLTANNQKPAVCNHCGKKLDAKK